MFKCNKTLNLNVFNFHINVLPFVIVYLVKKNFCAEKNLDIYERKTLFIHSINFVKRNNKILEF